jgi:hypothetical protein
VTKNEAIRLLRLAEETLWLVSMGQTSTADAVQRKIHLALRANETGMPGGACLACGNPLTQPETGRPRLYCADKCRKAAHRAPRQH